jgi:hypothetical protein
LGEGQHVEYKDQVLQEAASCNRRQQEKNTDDCEACRNDVSGHRRRGFDPVSHWVLRIFFHGGLHQSRARGNSPRG